jgi:hypothetical protein
MHAQYDKDGTIAVSGDSRVETFTRIWAGIGWPDRESGCVCAVGQRPDGRYHALWEQSGGLWELGEAAVGAKDRLLIECFWVDGRDTLATSYLRTLDGLCFHEESPARKPASVGALCRSVKRCGPVPELPTASVMPVPDRVIDNFRSALEKARGIIMQGRILIHESNCPKLLYTIRQPLDDLLKSPAMKALVWVVTALEEANGCAVPEEGQAGPWYTNFCRGAI